MKWSLFLLLSLSSETAALPFAQADPAISDDEVVLFQTATFLHWRSRLLEDATHELEEDTKALQTFTALHQPGQLRSGVELMMVRQNEGAQSRLTDLQDELETVVLQRDHALDLAVQSNRELISAKDDLHKALMQAASSTGSQVNVTAGAGRSVVVIVQNSALDAIVMIFEVALFFIFVSVFFLHVLNAMSHQIVPVAAAAPLPGHVQHRISTYINEEEPAAQPGRLGPTTAQERREAVEFNRRLVAQGVFFGSWVLLLATSWFLAIFFYFYFKYYFFGWWVWAETKDAPCDAPLSTWLILVLVSNIISTLAGGDTNPSCAVFFLIWNAGLFIMGMVWINSSTTCKNTNSELYWFVHEFLVFIIVRIVVLTVIVTAILSVVSVVVFSSQYGWLDGINAASPDVIERMEVVDPAALKQVPGAPEECSICYDEWADADPLDEGKEIKKTGCGHYFHKECLGKWLKNAKTCPLCRLDLQEAMDQSCAGGSGGESKAWDPSQPDPFLVQEA